MLALALVRLRDVYERRSGHLDWQAKMRRCAAAHEPAYPLPVHRNGTLPTPWTVTIASPVCAAAVRR